MTARSLAIDFSFLSSSFIVLAIAALFFIAGLAFNTQPTFAAIPVGPCNDPAYGGAICPDGSTCSGNECIMVTGGSSKDVEHLNQANEESLETPSFLNSVDTQWNGIILGALNSFGGSRLGFTHRYDGSPTGGGVAGVLGSSVAMIYKNQPANTATYVADVLNNAHIVTPAYAQGIGFSALNPILETWKVFRNLAYLFFVLIFLVIGFMIMLRRKVGQAAVTAQQAIPQIILALVVVTFSYAIAGLMIDLMYLIMFFMVGVFGQEAELIDKNFVQLGLYMVTQGWRSIEAIGAFVDSTLQSLTEIVAEPVEFISEIAFLLIITVAILIGMFRLFFLLLKTYVEIIASIAFAPVVLMMDAIPGRKVFVGWLQSLFGNLMAFPTVLMVLIFYDMLLDAKGISEAGFIPPYLFGSGSGGVIPSLVGLGLILALPDVVTKVKESLGAKDTWSWLTNAAMKSLTRGEVALPVVGAGAGLGYGAYRGVTATRDSGESGIDRFRAIAKSARDYGWSGEGRGEGARTGWSVGRNLLRQYQWIKEGRAFQVDDTEKLLRSIAGEGKSKRTGEEKPPTGADTVRHGTG